MFVELMEAVMETLPHGSGIDCDWTYEISTVGVRFRNSFHLMDEGGGYEGYQDFSVLFYFDGTPFKLAFQNPIRKTKSAAGLREYLEDTFANWEEEFKNFLFLEKLDVLFYKSIRTKYAKEG